MRDGIDLRAPDRDYLVAGNRHAQAAGVGAIEWANTGTFHVHDGSLRYATVCQPTPTRRGLIAGVIDDTPDAMSTPGVARTTGPLNGSSNQCCSAKARDSRFVA